jgi:hypothetical protein
MRKEKIKEDADFKAGAKGDDSDEEEALFSQQSLLEKYHDASNYLHDTDDVLKKMDERNKK